jgi:hypothetical protein
MADAAVFLCSDGLPRKGAGNKRVPDDAKQSARHAAHCLHGNMAVPYRLLIAAISCVGLAACGQTPPVPAGTESSQPTDQPQVSPVPDGTASSATDDPTDQLPVVSANPWEGASCPPTEPTDGGPCEFKGLTCRYSEPLKDHVCTEELRWRSRWFVVSAEAGAAENFSIEQPPQESCYSDGPSCPTESKQCVVGCCRNGGNKGGGCAGCCQEQLCERLPPEECPAQRCKLRRGCDGTILCTTPTYPDPPCGTPGSWAETCCEGLVETCAVKIVSDGSCLPDFGYNGTPICLRCGDGLCEVSENECNCPADCD